MNTKGSGYNQAQFRNNGGLPKGLQAGLFVMAVLLCVAVVGSLVFGTPTTPVEYGQYPTPVPTEVEQDNCPLAQASEDCVKITQHNWSWVGEYSSGYFISTSQQGDTSYSNLENVPGTFPGYLAFLHPYDAGNGLVGYIPVACRELGSAWVRSPNSGAMSGVTTPTTIRWYGCLKPAIVTPVVPTP